MRGLQVNLNGAVVSSVKNSLQPAFSAFAFLCVILMRAPLCMGTLGCDVYVLPSNYRKIPIPKLIIVPMRRPLVAQ